MTTTPTTEHRIARLIKRHQLSRIELNTPDGRRFWAVAYPSPWGQFVNARREAAFRAADNFPTFSLAEATAIGEKAAADPICRMSGDSILHAIETLEGALPAYLA